MIILVITHFLLVKIILVKSFIVKNLSFLWFKMSEFIVSYLFG